MSWVGSISGLHLSMLSGAQPMPFFNHGGVSTQTLPFFNHGGVSTQTPKFMWVELVDCVACMASFQTQPFHRVVNVNPNPRLPGSRVRPKLPPQSLI